MPQPSTLCVITPNPALDRILIVPELQPGTIRRVSDVQVAAGGKGFNVTRAAQAIEVNAVVCAPLGGLTGQQVAWLAAQEGLPMHTVTIGGETRICTLLIDPTTERVTVLNEVGPCVSESEWREYVDRILAIPTAWYLICGSLPPGPPPTVLSYLIEVLHRCGRRVMVDTSGPALAAAVAAKPDVVKVNGAELGSLLDVSIDNVAIAQRAVEYVYRQGISRVVVTLGAHGAVGIDKEGGVLAIPPPITAHNPIGCGDSFFAGFAAAISTGESLAEALRIATACAVADAQTLAPGAINRAVVDGLLPQVAISYW